MPLPIGEDGRAAFRMMKAIRSFLISALLALPLATFGQGGDTDFARLMGGYPNLIQVSGHSHATLEDERSISQDLGFTAIQDSTIGAYYENETGKVDPDSGDGASVPPQTSDAYTEGKGIQEPRSA